MNKIFLQKQQNQNLNQKHLAVKKLQPRTITGHAEKDVKSKMGGQGQRSDSADGNKF